MEIVNEIKSKNQEEKQKFEHRSLAEIQRRKLEKLMKNPVRLKLEIDFAFHEFVTFAFYYFRINQLLFQRRENPIKSTLHHRSSEM